MERLMNKEELSQYLGISIATINKMVCNNDLPHLKIGRLVRFSEMDIKEYLNELKVK
jgi:excisionase family DNA binding protein